MVLKVCLNAYLPTMLQSFIKLIRPHIEYGNIIWNPRFKKDIEAIERVQRRATTLVHNVRNMSYSDRLKVLKIPSLTYRRFIGDMIQVYKLWHNFEDIPFTRFFEINEYPTRGHARKFKKKSCKKEICKNFFSLRVISPWNGLPDQIVTAPSVYTFKNPLDIFKGDKQYSVFPDNPWGHNREGDI